MNVYLDLETVAPSVANAGRANAGNVEFWTEATLKAVEQMAANVDRDPEEYGALTPPLATVASVALLAETGKWRVLLNGDFFKAAPTAEEVLTLLLASRRLRFQDSNDGEVVRCTDEGALLKDLNRVLDTGRNTYVTYSGRRFDVPVIVHRSVANMVKCETAWRMLREYRYKPELHLDLADYLTGFGACPTPPLRAFGLSFFGVDFKELGDGSDVASLVSFNNPLRLAAYNLSDVVALRMVHQACL
jgi:hypothetical protein